MHPDNVNKEKQVVPRSPVSKASIFDTNAYRAFTQRKSLSVARETRLKLRQLEDDAGTLAQGRSTSFVFSYINRSKFLTRAVGIVLKHSNLEVRFSTGEYASGYLGSNGYEKT